MSNNITKHKVLLGSDPVEKTVVMISAKEGKAEKDEKTVDSLHHIHIIDRSGSMSGYLRDLVENVKQTIRSMSDDDFVTVIWFSGVGEYRTVLKGAKKDQQSMDKILDELKWSVGMTCFSQAVAEAKVVVGELRAICPNFNVTLFTDGQPCVYGWSAQEEQKRVLDIVDSMKSDILAFNTVGYGWYYDRDFLTRASQLSQFGQMVHATNIAEYQTIWQHNFERITGMVAQSLSVVPWQNAEVLYISSKNTKLAKGELNLTALDKRKNQVFMIIDSTDNPDSAVFGIDGEIVDTSKLKVTKLKAETLDYLRYAYATEKYYDGKREAALDVLAQIGDKGLIDSHVNAFTYDEVEAQVKKLRQATLDPKKRNLLGKVPAGYLPKEDAVCAVDVIKALGNGHSFYVPVKNYNRIGLKVNDEFNLFSKDDSKFQCSPFGAFTFNKEKLNLSVMFSVSGSVDLNPLQAKKVGLEPKFATAIYRNHTVIKDGNLNIPEFTAIMDNATLQSLEGLEEAIATDAGFIKDVKPFETAFDGRVEGREYFEVAIKLSDIPIINKTYANRYPDGASVFTAVKRMAELEAAQKVVKHFIGEAKESNTAVLKESWGGDKTYTKDQIDLLSEHGLDSKGRYSGVARKTEEKGEDFYEARTLEFTLKGFSSLPTVAKVQEKIAKANDPKTKFNGPESLMRVAVDHLVASGLEKGTVESTRTLQSQLGSIQSELFSIRANLASAKIAKILTGGWWEGFSPDGDGGYVYDKADPVMVIKAEREKVYMTADKDPAASAPEPVPAAV
jgi:hypothetical protein